MENKQWLEHWVSKKSYTKDDILHIVGRRQVAESGDYYTKGDILRILGPSDSLAASYTRNR